MGGDEGDDGHGGMGGDEGDDNHGIEDSIDGFGGDILQDIPFEGTLNPEDRDKKLLHGDQIIGLDPDPPELSFGVERDIGTGVREAVEKFEELWGTK